jgi:hypothetical protein
MTQPDPAAPTTPDPSSNGPPAEPPGEPAAAERTLTQTQVNQIVADARSKTKTKAEQDLAAALGVSLEQAKQIIKEHQDRDAATKTEAEREREAATKAKTEAEAEKAAAARERWELRVDSALLRAGAPNEDAKLTRLRGMVTVGTDADPEAIKTDVDSLKTEFPALFQTEATPAAKPGRAAPSADPHRTPAGKTQDKTAYQRGLERAKSHYPQPT